MLWKWCTDFMGNAAKGQWIRLEAAGYEEELIKRQLELKVEDAKGTSKKENSSDPGFPWDFP